MPQTFNVGSRCAFVNATAWLFMLVSVAVAAAALAAPLGLAWWTPRALAVGGLPWLSAQLASHWPWAMGGSALLALALGAGAVGLLLRLEWARRLFMAALVLMLAGQLLGLWLQHEFVSVLVQSTLAMVPLPAPAAGVFGGLALAAQILSWLLSLAAAAAMLWVLRRLGSDSVRQEFA